MTAAGDHAPHRLTCAWCEAPLSARVLSSGVAPCHACGSATTDPWPSDAELDAAYAGWYRPGGGRFSGPGDAVLRWARGRLAARLDRVAPAGPVLDVGSGDGALLDALGARGRNATGLERRSTRPDVEEAGLSELDGEWAAVVFWHSLEHMRSPGIDLAQAARLLAPGGVLVVALPDFASVQARVFGPRWFALDLPRHLVHVPGPALTARLERCGLQVERVSHLRGGQSTFGWLHGLVGTISRDLDLYAAIRTQRARERPLRCRSRVAALAAAGALLPAASLLALAEAAAHRGGTLYVEARKPADNVTR